MQFNTWKPASTLFTNLPPFPNSPSLSLCFFLFFLSFSVPAKNWWKEQVVTAEMMNLNSMLEIFPFTRQFLRCNFTLHCSCIFTHTHTCICTWYLCKIAWSICFVLCVCMCMCFCARLCSVRTLSLSVSVCVILLYSVYMNNTSFRETVYMYLRRVYNWTYVYSDLLNLFGTLRSGVLLGKTLNN